MILDLVISSKLGIEQDCIVSDTEIKDLGRNFQSSIFGKLVYKSNLQLELAL